MRIDYARRGIRVSALAMTWLLVGCAASSGPSASPVAPASGTASPGARPPGVRLPRRDPVTLPPLAASPSEDISGQEITVMLPDWANVPPEVLADFTAKTGVKVTINVAGFGAIHDKVAVAGAANTPLADVTEFDWTWTGQFAIRRLVRAARWPARPGDPRRHPERDVIQHGRPALCRLLQQRLPDRRLQHRAVHEGRHHGCADDVRRAPDRSAPAEEHGRQQVAAHDPPVGVRGHVERVVPADDGDGRHALRRRRPARLHRPGIAGLQGLRIHGQRLQGRPRRARGDLARRRRRRRLHLGRCRRHPDRRPGRARRRERPEVIAHRRQGRVHARAGVDRAGWHDRLAGGPRDHGHLPAQGRRGSVHLLVDAARHAQEAPVDARPAAVPSECLRRS